MRAQLRREVVLDGATIISPCLAAQVTENPTTTSAFDRHGGGD